MPKYFEGDVATGSDGKQYQLDAQAQWQPYSANPAVNAIPSAIRQGVSDIASKPGEVAQGALSGVVGSLVSAASNVSPLLTVANQFGVGPDNAVPAAPTGTAGTVGDIAGSLLPGLAGAATGLASKLLHPLAKAAASVDAVHSAITAASGGADAIVSKAEQAAGRVLKGYMTPEELAQQGATIPKSGEMALNATTPGELQAAKVQRWKEDSLGLTTPEVAIGQKQAFTEMIKKEAGLTGVENLTPVVVSDLIKNSGAKIGQITAAKGPISLGDSATAMQDMIKLAPRDAKGPLGSVIKDLKANAEANGGKITPEAYQYALTNAGEIGAPGSSAERVMYANKITDHLHNLLQGQLSGNELAALKQARYQYKIGKTLQDGAAVGPDGLANPASFGNKWDKKIGQTLRGKDLLGKAADTFNFLGSQQAHAGNTLQRLFYPAMGAAKAHPVQTTIGVVGAGGIGGGINSLFR
jgi:hypothetical protein